MGDNSGMAAVLRVRKILLANIFQKEKSD